MIEQRIPEPRTLIDITIDGESVSIPEGSTVLEACDSIGKDVPTLCYLKTLEPINSCRACVVEVEGSRTLVPACSREITDGMDIQTESPRVQQARKTVYEALADKRQNEQS